MLKKIENDKDYKHLKTDIKNLIKELKYQKITTHENIKKDLKTDTILKKSDKNDFNKELSILTQLINKEIYEWQN